MAGLRSSLSCSWRVPPWSEPRVRSGQAGSVEARHGVEGRGCYRIRDHGQSRQPQGRTRPKTLYRFRWRWLPLFRRWCSDCLFPPPTHRLPDSGVSDGAIGGNSPARSRVSPIRSGCGNGAQNAPAVRRAKGGRSVLGFPPRCTSAIPKPTNCCNGCRKCF